jgi:nucleotide-binding universal stress UspA family protein
VVLYVVPEHLPGEFSQIGLILREKQLVEQAREALPAFCRSNFPADCTWEDRVETGFPPWTICNVARELPANLIVISSHGHSGLKRVLLGSVAERVAQHAPCAVLVVRNASSPADPGFS